MPSLPKLARSFEESKGTRGSIFGLLSKREFLVSSGFSYAGSGVFPIRHSSKLTSQLFPRPAMHAGHSARWCFLGSGFCPIERQCRRHFIVSAQPFERQIKQFLHRTTIRRPCHFFPSASQRPPLASSRGLGLCHELARRSAIWSLIMGGMVGGRAAAWVTSLRSCSLRFYLDCRRRGTIPDRARQPLLANQPWSCGAALGSAMRRSSNVEMPPSL